MSRFYFFLFLLPAISFGAFDKGFNFRATSGFVTDGTNETWVIDTEAYPTTRNGVTFGWNTTTCLGDQGGGSRDRNAGIDRRIAGINFIGNQLNQCTFKVDLPSAGTYSIQLGYGDAGGNSQNNYIVVKDGATALISLSPVATLATPTFGDAAGSTFTAANWPGSEVSVTKTFAGTTLTILFGSGLASDGTNSTIDHLFVSQISATTGNITTTSGTGSISTISGTGSVIIK